MVSRCCWCCWSEDLWHRVVNDHLKAIRSLIFRECVVFGAQTGQIGGLGVGVPKVKSGMGWTSAEGEDWRGGQVLRPQATELTAGAGTPLVSSFSISSPFSWLLSFTTLSPAGFLLFPWSRLQIGPMQRERGAETERGTPVVEITSIMAWKLDLRR